MGNELLAAPSTVCVLSSEHVLAGLQVEETISDIDGYKQVSCLYSPTAPIAVDGKLTFRLKCPPKTSLVTPGYLLAGNRTTALTESKEYGFEIVTSSRRDLAFHFTTYAFCG